VTINANFPVVQRPWKGYEDRGLPVGMWVAQGSVQGDASGGQMTVAFNFKGEGEALGARFYNLEQIEVHTTANSVANGGLVIENFDIVATTGLINRQKHLAIESDGTTDASLRDGEGPRLPIFLGRPQLVDLATDLRVAIPNALNEVLFFTGQEYIWEPRSLLTDGGLRRPLDSLYGG